MKINNANSSDALLSINQNKTSTDKTLAKIAAMHTINNDSPADLMIYNTQQSQILEASQKLQNANESYAMMQISDKSLQTLHQGVTELQMQSVARNSAALNDEQRSMIDSASQATLRTMQATINQTTYNGQNLLGDISLEGLQSGDEKSLENFVSMLDGRLSDVGSTTNEILSQINQYSTAMQSLSSAKQNREYSVVELLSDLQADNTKTTASLLSQQHNTNLLAQRMATLLG